VPVLSLAQQASGHSRADCRTSAHPRQEDLTTAEALKERLDLVD